MQNTENTDGRFSGNGASRLAEHILLGMLLLLGFIIRLHHLDAPISDLHSWNQASAATVTRNIHRNPSTIFKPQWDVLKHGCLERQSGAEEFPVYHALVAAASPSEKHIPAAGRLVSITICLLGGLALWRLCRRRFGSDVAITGLAVYLISPIGAYFGRSVASDAFAVALSIIALDFIDLHREKGKARFLLSGIIALSLSALAKPYQLVCLLPAVYLLFEKERTEIWKKPSFYLTILVPIFLTFLWTAWAISLGSMGNILEANESILHNTLFGPFILLWSKSYWSVLGARLWREVLTPLPTLLAVVGLAIIFIKRDVFMMLWLASQMIYLFVVRQGNMVHNYYQFLLLPCLAVLVGHGAARALSAIRSHRNLSVPAVVIIAVAMAATGYSHLKSFYRFDDSSPLAGKMIRQHCDDRAPVIIWEPDRDRKTQTIYYADRKGWFFRKPSPKAIERHIQLGAVCLSANLPEVFWQRRKDVAEYLKQNFTLQEEQKSHGRFREKRIIRLYAVNPEESNPIPPPAEIPGED